MGTALITGASAGLGVELARLFAADGHDLVLTARRLDRLEALAGELAREHSVRAHTIACDLAAADGARRLVAELAERALEIDFLVNNAGAGASGAFAELDLEHQLALIRLNVASLVELTGALVPGMIRRGQGRILNLGSTAGFQPGPHMAVYFASKAFVNSFSEALAHELRGTGVTATVSCPGPTATEFADVAGAAKSRLFRLVVARADTVARQAYRAMHGGRALYIHGFQNRLTALLSRLSPRALTRAVTARLTRPPEQKALPSLAEQKALPSPAERAED